MSGHPSIFPNSGIYTSIRRPDNVFWSDAGTQSAWATIAYIDIRCGTLTYAVNIAYVTYASEAKERTTLKPVAHSRHYVPPSLKGIRENILEKIDGWLQDVDGHNICWIRGLSNTVTAAVWHTVARDLTRFVAPNWVSGLKSDPEKSSIYCHCESLFTEPLTKKDECYSPSTNHLTEIDALDECPSQAGKRDDILHTISHKSRLPCAFKLTVTGCDKRLSGSFRWSCMQIELPLGAEINSDIPQDIHLFIKQRFADIDSQFPAGRTTQIVLDVLATVAYLLATMAAGVFVWVETALRLMGLDALDKWLQRVIDGEMNAMENINRHYRQTLELPCLGSNDHSTLGMCKRTVTFIVLNKTPLLGNDFSPFVLKLPSLGRFILDKLTSVISVRHGTVILNCHMSFRDLLRVSYRCTGQPYIGRESHKVPIICRRIIRKAAGFNICGFVKLLPDMNVDDLSERIPQMIARLPLCWYQYHSWATHNRGTPEESAALIEYIKYSYLMYWPEVLSPTERVTTLDGNRAASGFYTECIHILDGERVWDPKKGIWDTTIRFWNSLTGDIISGTDDADCVRAVAFSPDGERVVSESFDKHTIILDVMTEEIISGPNDGHIDCIRPATLSLDFRCPVSVSGSSDRTIWDLYNRKAILGPHEYTDYISSVAFSSDGRRVVSGSSDKTICIRDVNIGQVIAGPIGLVISGPLEGHADCIRFSPDGRRVVSGSSDRAICIWNVNTGQVISDPLECHTNCIGSVAFSPDSKHVVPGSSYKAIDVGAVERFSGPMKSYSKSASISFNSKGIVSGSDHQSRDAQTVFSSFEGYSNRVWSVTFSPDDKPIASSSDKFLQTGMISVVHVLRERATSCLDTILRQTPESKSNTVTSPYCGDTALEKLWDAYPRYRFTQSHLKFLGTLADLRDQPGWVFPTAAKILVNVTQTDDMDTWSGQVEGSEERGMFLSNSVEPVEPNPSSVWPNIWSFI